MFHPFILHGGTCKSASTCVVHLVSVIPPDPFTGKEFKAEVAASGDFSGEPKMGAEPVVPDSIAELISQAVANVHDRIGESV